MIFHCRWLIKLREEHIPRAWEGEDDLNLYNLSDQFTEISPKWWQRIDTRGLALRNRLKLEYVKARDFGCECFSNPPSLSLSQNHYTNEISVSPNNRSTSYPGLAEVLVQKITWSSDTSTSCGYDDPVWPDAFELCRGSWAGDRFDLVEEDFDWEGYEWVDVGEKIIREVFQLYRDSGEEIKGRDR